MLTPYQTRTFGVSPVSFSLQLGETTLQNRKSGEGEKRCLEFGSSTRTAASPASASAKACRKSDLGLGKAGPMLLIVGTIILHISKRY